MTNIQLTKRLVVAVLVLFFIFIGVLLLFVTELTWEEVKEFIIRVIGALFILVGFAGISALIDDFHKSKYKKEDLKE